ncbi:MAG: cation-translocating P-type ATPase [Pseudomonadota bacterium]
MNNGMPSTKTPIGLSSSEAAELLASVGPNEIQHAAVIPPWRLLAGQFNSPVIWLLLGACVVSAVLGEATNAIAIGSIVVINAFVGFFQEYRAERAVNALRSMTAPRANVLRDGMMKVIPAMEVVPGDILLIEAGDVVAADAHLLEAHSLSVNEAALTGESQPSEKSILPVATNAPLAERHDSIFLGTAVVSGTAVAKITATGMATELGKIAHLLASVQDEATPLQQRLARVSKSLLFICLGIVSAVAILGVVRGTPLLEVFLSAVSLAVAAVPEGLPAVVTIALAVGVQRMAARKVLVRRLPAVETLGCTTVICTDKTGTLTTGVMAVRELWGPDHVRLLDVAAACCNGELAQDERSGVGDTTEVALLMAAVARGIHRKDIEQQRPRVMENPFDSERKRMSILRSDGVLYVKGAVDLLLPLCRGDNSAALAANADMSSRGLRVLAMAVGKGREENELELVGLTGIADPPRTEAIAAIASARGAGIRTVMITGDHPITAQAIALELGLLQKGEAAQELVHARATPEDKLKIVKKFKEQGAIVAMTGDGVNDAPALREAHIGIAMGKNGTEVTREAADVVLSDDNFASIVAAVEEGRGIFDNIRKTLVYLLAGNAGELMLMFSAALLGLPLPLLPLHLLWINLVTDGLPALALVTDPLDRNVMKRPPRDPREPILGKPQWRRILVSGLLQASVALAVFVWALENRDLNEARNLAFTTLVFAELFRAFSARSSMPFWEVGIFTNMRLFGIVVVSVVVQLGIHHIPATQALFEIHDLSLEDCILSLAVGLIPLVITEMVKVVVRLGNGTEKSHQAGTPLGH